jgi:DNA-binding transcriptional regulator PaaX
MTKIELVNTLENHKRSRSIQKEKNEKGSFYTLTERGEAKLAFYEYSYQCYQRWQPKWCIGEDNGWANEYYTEMTDLIKKLDYFGYENVKSVG